MDLRLRTLLRENEAGLAAGAAKVRWMSDPRAERFGRLFPGARGLWNEAVPAGYEQLRQGIRRCYYGHIHGYGIRSAFNGEKEGIRLKLISADALSFAPLRIS